MSKCKYYKQQKQVSWDSGQTWSNVSPAVYQVGNLYEMDSIDCSHGSSQIRWVVVPGDYLCDGKDKYVKEIEQYSVDGGETWLNVYPTTYRTGALIEPNSSLCDNKWEGHYIDDTNYDPPPIQHDCPNWYKWVDGVGCVYVDPVKIIRCSMSSSTTLTQADVTYNPYKLIYGTIGDCVNTIGQYAFSQTDITDITIPSSVTSICYYAFNHCDELETCIIEGNTTRGTVIGDNTFEYDYSLSNVYFGSGVTSIGNEAFRYCYNLASIVIPDSVSNIGQYAFYACTGLISATIGSGITSIADATFSGCRSLTSVTIPNGVTTIGEFAFNGCSSLTSVTIPDSVTTIGQEAFQNCSGLTSATIGSGVTSLGYWIFYDASGLTGITLLAPTPPSIQGSTFDGTNNCPIYVPCESIATYKREWNDLYNRLYPIPPCGAPPVPTNYKVYETYSGGVYNVVECNSSTTLTQAETGSDSASKVYIVDASVGNCVTTIGSSAFYGCASLSSVTISDTVTNIGNLAFEDCTSLSSVTIPSGVTSIGNRAFNGCSSLTSITIPSGITSIGSGVCSGCTSLTSITVNAVTPPTIQSNTFDDTNNCPIYVPCESVITYRAADKWKNIKTRIQGIPPCVIPLKLRATYSNSAVYELDCNDSSRLTEAEITSYTTSRTAMTEAIVGDCVTILGSYVFHNCWSLSSVTIPNTVTSIGSYAFDTCSGLTSIVIPDSVTIIGGTAFHQCSGLTSIDIPSSVTSIGTRAFEYCRNLVSVTVNSNTPPSLGSYVFDYTSANLVIYVPSASVNTYKTSADWSDYASRIQAIPT